MGAEFVGVNLIFLPVVDSTNSYAMQLLKNVKPPEGTVVHAAQQTRGRGQRGKAWMADAGLNLTLSAVFYPEFLELQKQRFLYQIAALACYDTIAEFIDGGQFDIKIKWPNDILVNRKKLSGILIENNLLENKILSTIIGIGLNVNQTSFSNEYVATSLKLLAEKHLDIKTMLPVLCHKLEHYYCLLKKGDTNSIGTLYHSRLFGMGDWREFIFRKNMVRMKVLGLSELGLLKLLDEANRIVEVDAQEISWIL